MNDQHRVQWFGVSSESDLRMTVDDQNGRDNEQSTIGQNRRLSMSRKLTVIGQGASRKSLSTESGTMKIINPKRA